MFNCWQDGSYTYWLIMKRNSLREKISMRSEGTRSLAKKITPPKRLLQRSNTYPRGLESYYNLLEYLRPASSQNMNISHTSHCSTRLSDKSNNDRACLSEWWWGRHGCSGKIRLNSSQQQQSVVLTCSSSPCAHFNLWRMTSAEQKLIYLFWYTQYFEKLSWRIRVSVAFRLYFCVT